ncbi:MAG TPA: DNA primase [Acidimicrobiia bacterium]
MGILDEDVQRVREATDLVALVQEHVGLRRVGRRFSGLCPFHKEKSPSFSVNPAMSVYYCFGCQASGDAITFVREVEHLDFVGAVERLAARAGIQLRYDDANVSKDRQRKNRLNEAVAAAIDYYHERLLEASDARNARGYLRSRGFDGDAARRFKLGYSPSSWDELSRHLQKAKFSRDDITGANLAFVNRANKLQDTFRDRLMFPIWDNRGDAVGFGARALPDAAGVAPPPKYKNTADTPIYRKSTLLYGLHWAKGEIVARGEVVICEGYTDVMAFHLAGVPNAVATCGTALADEHFVALKNLARKITLAYDADAAGQAAAERCYQWEQRFDVAFQVADLPAGHDPGDLWHDDPGRLTKAVEGATPFMQFRLDRALAGADLSTIEGRARAANAAVGIIAQHPNDFVRDEYVMRAAATLRTDNVQRLRDEVAKVRRGAKPSIGARANTDADAADAAPRRVAYDRRELDALRWIVNAPELVATHVHSSLFGDVRLRAAFELLLESATYDAAIAAADPDTASLLHRLAVEEPTGTDNDEVLASRVIVNLVEASSQRLVATMLREGDARSAAIKSLVDALVRARDAGNWDEAVRIADELVAWTASIGTDSGEHHGRD